MSSPGCTRHVVEMTNEQSYLQHLTDRAATAAASDRSLPTFSRNGEREIQSLLRTNETPAPEAGVRINDRTLADLYKSSGSSHVTLIDRTLGESVLARRNGNGHSLSSAEEEHAPQVKTTNWGNLYTISGVKPRKRRFETGRY